MRMNGRVLTWDHKQSCMRPLHGEQGKATPKYEQDSDQLPIFPVAFSVRSGTASQSASGTARDRQFDHNGTSGRSYHARQNIGRHWAFLGTSPFCPMQQPAVYSDAAEPSTRNKFVKHVLRAETELPN